MREIAYLTDIHLNEQFPIDNNVNSIENFERVLADLSDRKINKIIFGGDIGEVSSHNYFFANLEKFSLNLVLGNHDKCEEVTKHIMSKNEKDELYYYLEDDKFKYLFLDTSKGALSKQQLAWLKKNLLTNKRLMLFIHHPVIKIDTPIDKLYPLKNRERLKSVLVGHGESITIFCGHYHMNDERTYKNIKQFTTQSLSYQIVKDASELKVDNTKFGYRIIQMNHDAINTELINFKIT